MADIMREDNATYPNELTEYIYILAPYTVWTQALWNKLVAASGCSQVFFDANLKHAPSRLLSLIGVYSLACTFQHFSKYMQDNSNMITPKKTSTVYNGKFSWGAKFRIFRGQSSNVNIKTRINSHAPVFHIQRNWWVWFPGIEPRPMTIFAEGSGAK